MRAVTAPDLSASPSACVTIKQTSEGGHAAAAAPAAAASPDRADPSEAAAADAARADQKRKTLRVLLGDDAPVGRPRGSSIRTDGLFGDAEAAGSGGLFDSDGDSDGGSDGLFD